MCRANNNHTEIRNTYTILIGKRRGKISLGNPGVDLDGTATSRQTLKRRGVRLWIEFISIRIVLSGGVL
jgi:hypothetical protein